MNPTKTFSSVGQGVDNGEPRIAEIVAQSRENAVNPSPFEPVAKKILFVSLGRTHS